MKIKTYFAFISKICYRELRDMFRDNGILIFIIFVPLVYPLLYAAIYDNEVVREVPIAVVDDNNSSLSRQLLRNLEVTPDVKIISHCNNMSQAQQMMRHREVFGIIHIPASLSTDIYRERQAVIGLYCDMSSMLYYKALLVATTNVSLDINKNIKVSRYIPASTDRLDDINKTPITYDYVSLYNPQSGFAAFLIPPVLMLIIQQTIFLGVCMSAGNNRERYHEALVPNYILYRNPIITTIGKALPYLFIYIVWAVYMFTFVTDLFTLPRLGHYLTFIIFVIPYILSCTFLAMALSSFIYRREDSILLIVFLSVPLLFLSGLSWPNAAMAPFWRIISYLFPSTFGMMAYMRISAMGASLSDISNLVIPLCVQCIIYFIFACFIFYRHAHKVHHI